MRLVYITAPLWAPFYYVFIGEWRVAVMMTLYIPWLFPLGVVLHTSCAVCNAFDRIRLYRY